MPKKEQVDFEQLYEAKKSLPLRVSRIIITGLKAIDKSVIFKEFADVRDAETLDDLRERLLEAHAGIASLRVFKGCEVQLLPPRSGKPDQVDVVVKVVERTVGASIEVNTSRGETNAGASCTYYNLLGRPNMISGEVQRGSKSSMVGRVRLSFPHVYRIRDSLVSLDAFQSFFHRTHSSHSETTRGVGLSYTDGRHTIGLDGHWREIAADVEKASLAIRELAGDSLKTSIRYEYVSDTRNHPWVPTSGFYFLNKAEYAGLHGDVRFCRNETTAQAHIPLPLGLAAHFCCMGGMLHTPSGVRSCITDRFFLGGSNSLRGFRTHSVGPEMDGDALGGEVVGAASVALSTGFEFLPKDNFFTQLGIRGYGFLNAGNAMLRKAGASRQHEAQRFANGAEAAVGLGIAIPFPVGRFEINFCRPLRTTDGNAGRFQKFQVGLGITI